MIRTVSLLKFLYPALALFWEICYRYLNDRKWRSILCHHISVLFYHGFFPLSRGIWQRLGIAPAAFLLSCGQTCGKGAPSRWMGPLLVRWITRTAPRRRSRRTQSRTSGPAAF